MTILVIAEHNNVDLSATVLNTVGAALKLGTEMHLLIAGYQCHSVVEQACKINAIAAILVADAPCYQNQLAEVVAKLVANIGTQFTHVLTCASTTGKNMLPRAAALLDVQPITDVIEIEAEDIFTRPIYAGNIFARVKSTDPIKMLTIRSTAFEKVDETDIPAEITCIELNQQFDYPQSLFIKRELSNSERPDLGSAAIVVSGGRALGSAEKFKIIYQLADKMGAAVGASRAAVDEGFVANDVQIGQTGKIVAPDLYIALGISGAIQHFAGMKDSKIIVAINKDEEAPFFKVADYRMVADIFDVIPALDSLLS